jgi:hypothetical protein
MLYLFMKRKLEMYFEYLRFENKSLDKRKLNNLLNAWETEYNALGIMDQHNASIQDKSTYLMLQTNQFFDWLENLNWDVKEGELEPLVSKWNEEYSMDLFLEDKNL